jgi:hypothetical protein
MAQHSVTLGGVKYPLATYTIKDVMTLVPQLVEANLPAQTIKELERQTQLVHTEIVRGGGYSGDYQQFLSLEGVGWKDLHMAQKKIGQIVGHYAQDVPEDAAPGESTGAAESP